MQTTSTALWLGFLAFTSLAFVASNGCNGGGTTSPTMACVPGETTTCACSSGATGEQTCDSAGSGFGVCACAPGHEDASFPITEDSGSDDAGFSVDSGSEDAGAEDAGAVDSGSDDDAGSEDAGGVCSTPGEFCTVNSDCCQSSAEAVYGQVCITNDYECHALCTASDQCTSGCCIEIEGSTTVGDCGDYVSGYTCL